MLYHTHTHIFCYDEWMIAQKDKKRQKKIKKTISPCFGGTVIIYLFSRFYECVVILALMSYEMPSNQLLPATHSIGGKKSSTFN